MNPKFRVKDLMDRTKVNLDFIYEHRNRESGPYEVTQLINSFLGAFVHVKEGFFEHVPADHAPYKNWPVIKTDPGYPDPKNLRELVRLIRNSLAHGNIDFIPNDNDDIAAVHIWNNDRNCAKIWGTEITVDDLRKLLEQFIRLMTPILKQHEPKVEHQP